MSARTLLTNLPIAPLHRRLNFMVLQPLLTQDDETVTVTRRRSSGSTGSGPRERADTPERQRESSGGAPPSGGGGGGGGSTGGGGGGGPMRTSGGAKLPGGGLGIIGVIVVVVLYMLFGHGNGSQTGSVQEPAAQDDTAQESSAPEPSSQEAEPTATSNNAASNTPSTSASSQGTASSAGATAGGDTWTVMIYQDADDKVLEKDIFVDFNEAERVGSTDNVHIVAQLDRFQGGYDGDGNWTSTKRFLVTKDDDLNHIASKQVADLGEVNMGDPATLVDFATWAMKTYPADKYALILSDHGMGWPGGMTDPTGRGGGSSTPLASKLPDLLLLNEIDDALAQIRQQSGVDKLELFGMDACLMAHLEVFAALEPHARYVVASQETEPALGWAYTSFLDTLVANPAMSGADLSKAIVDSYISDDQRVLDDNARADLVGRGQPMGGLFDILLGGGAAAGTPSAEEVASELGQNVTLAAVDMSQIPQLLASVDDLALALQEVDQRAVDKARSYTQSFTSVFGKQVPASYIDLGHFAYLFQKAKVTGDLGTAVEEVLNNLGQAVISEKNGPKLPGATGVSIYFPVSDLYRSPEAGPKSYVPIADHFAQESLWDDFLAFHYTGREFEAATKSAVIPTDDADIRAAGAGGITVSPVTLSANTVKIGDVITMSTHIDGQNVGYVYFFTGFFDASANSLYIVDKDYLQSAETGEANGIFYPVWPADGSFNLQFAWEPIFFAMTDGRSSATALFEPDTYGADQADATYTVEGTYTYGDDGSQLAARLYFSDGVLRHVYGFNGTGSTGAPAEITPTSGDTFTIQESWMDLDANGNVTSIATQDGETLTFGDTTFTWEEQDAAAGQYVIGFIVEDLDGNQTQVFSQVEVQ